MRWSNGSTARPPAARLIPSRLEHLSRPSGICVQPRFAVRWAAEAANVIDAASGRSGGYLRLKMRRNRVVARRPLGFLFERNDAVVLVKFHDAIMVRILHVIAKDRGAACELRKGARETVTAEKNVVPENQRNMVRAD